jgi:hypothetical protein
MQLKVDRSNLSDSEKIFLIQRLTTVASEVQRASNILDGFRDFVRGGGSLSGETDIASVFKRMYSLMESQFLLRGIKLVLECEGNQRPIAKNLPAIERMIVHCLTYARDCLGQIGDWHEEHGLSYDRNLWINLVQRDGVNSLRIRWDLGRLSDGSKLCQPSAHVGLMNTKSVLESGGGSFDAADEGLTVVFS